MKRLSSFLLAISFILLIIPFTALLAAADNPSGSCGDNATWTFGSGTLVISGSGEMDDFVLLPWAFYKDEIKYVLVQDGITRICDNAFKNCTALELASIPDTVEFIGESAFENCTKLAEIILPKSLKTIDINAFKGCTAFTEITIPKKVTEIELGAFDDCKKISKINYEPVNIDSVSTCFANLGSQTSGVTVSFGEDVTVVPSNIFKDCTNVTAVSFGSNIEIIGKEAFMGCTGLQNVTLPNSLREIDMYAFKCCYAFTEITIPKKVTTIGLGAFNDCKSISKITYEPVNIDSVSTCFANVGSQTSGVTVSFGEDVTVVPSNLFKDCTNVTTVNFGSNIEIIGKEAFMGCTGLQNVTLPNSLREININAFKGCTAFTEITVPKKVTKIELGAFNDCKKVTKFNYNAQNISSVSTCLSKLGYSTDGVEVVFGDNVSVIPSYLFDECTDVVKVTLGSGLKTVGDKAFYSCSLLEEAVYNGSPSEWAQVTVKSGNDPLVNVVTFSKEDELPPEPEYTVGDINGNGKIDARDYLLLKRAYFGTYTLTCAPEAADINGNGKIDARDYLLLKRAYFGTYTIA